MAYVDSVLNYFAQDPLKLLYLVGGAGGIHYWITQWRDRRRISVTWWSKEAYYPARDANCDVKLLVEITNLGSGPTSLKPTVVVQGLTSEKELRRYVLEVTEEKRMLAPYDARRFEVTGSCEAVFSGLHYKTYSFSLTRGSTERVRIRDVKGERLRLPQFVVERCLFRLGLVRLLQWAKGLADKKPT